MNTPVLRVTATDMDAGANAEIFYSLDDTTGDSTYFAIDASTGIIKLTKALQEDMVRGSLAIIIITILILISCFVPPLLSISLFKISLLLPLSCIFPVRIIFSFPHPPKSASAPSGTYSLHTLPSRFPVLQASTKTFHLTARATDKGAAPLARSVPVSVAVVSSGSLPPTIVFQEPPRPIPENAPLDTTVASYCAQ